MKEVARLLTFVLLYIGGVALSRYLRDKPMGEGLAGAGFGALGIAAAWGVSAIRTVRAVLREHALLD